MTSGTSLESPLMLRLSEYTIPPAMEVKTSRAIAFLMTLRPHHWVKNILLFLPLALSHQIGAVEPLLNVAIAFCVMSLCASAVYVFNDIHDLRSDRSHPRKQHRPIASGAMPVRYALAVIPVLLAPAFLCANILLPWNFVVLLVLYIVLSLSYTLWLRQRRLLDVLTLTVLYGLRVLAGGVAGGVPASDWLLALAALLFLSLALTKRYAELVRLEAEGKEGVSGRGYSIGDRKVICVSGIASGYLAVVVFAAYCLGDRARELYPEIWALWAICPIALLWISRMWLLAGRNAALEDPVLFALGDVASLVIAVVVVGLLIVAASPAGLI